MSILINNLKRLLLDKFNLIIMVIMPVLFLAMFVFLGSSEMPVRVGVIDGDNTFLTGYLVEGLKKNCTVLTLEYDEIKENMLNDRIEYAIYIPKDFTEDIISGKDTAIKGYGIKNNNAFIPAKVYINGFISSAKGIGKASSGDAEVFRKGMEYYIDGSIAASYLNASDYSLDFEKTLQNLGILIMFMMYLGVDAAVLIAEDKELKTYERILMSPINLKRYMFESVLSFFAIIWIQIFLLFIIMKIIFGVSFGSSTFNIVIFTLIYSAVAVSLGMAIVNLSKSLKQASSLTPLIVVPMSMLGGCFWPTWIMPDIFQKISSFIPVTWAIQGMEKVLTGGSLLSAGEEIIIMLLFSLVFFLIGSARKDSFS